MRSLLLALLALPMVGCASYEYNISEPADLTRHIGKKEWVRVERAPLEYSFRTVENRLVIRAVNRTGDAVQLVGEKSAIADPRGQSHPVKSQAILPGSYMQIVLPPIRPYIYPTGPTFGIGVGTRIGSRPAPARWEIRQEAETPAIYLDIYEPNDGSYWEWEGDGPASVVLVFSHGDSAEEFRHAWTFQRQKM